jgi:hypothetical protein
MASQRAESTIVFLVPGWDETGTSSARTTRGTIEEGGADPTTGRVKQAVRVGTDRAGGEAVPVAAVPGEDVVVLEIANGPSLVLHPETARDLMLAQQEPGGTRSARAERGEGIDVPPQLRWRGVEATVPTRGTSRGFLGDVVLKAVRVLTGFGKDPVADFAASAVVRKFDGRVAEGVYRLRPDRLPALKGSGMLVERIEPASAPMLVLVHGTFSSTDGTFSKYWTEHPDLVRHLFAAYDDRVFALDHRTLGVSPITNALTLATALPDDARVHLLTHSRGGLVAEVLARICSDPDADLAPFAGREYASQRKELEALAAMVRRKRIKVDRVVRVACPARGTLLASRRLDAYLSVVRWTLKLAGLPIVPELVELLEEVARRRADPAVIPGLAAQVPDSPLVEWLHAARAPLDGDLRVIAGDMEGDSVTSWLKTLMADAFYWTDNDLVVQTRSMYGGGARRDTASFVLDQGGKVSHFGYFANDRTARAVLDGLTEARPGDFRPIGPLSAAGESATGTRAARRADRAASRGAVGDRPAVFLLPGILGSNLRVGDDRVWIGWRVVNGLDRLAFGKPKIEADGPIDAFYERLVEHLEATHDVVEFAFDWRRPIEEEARRLAGEVTRALDARTQSGQPVRMLAHSMGGVLARTMWLEEPAVWERMMAHDGARLLMLGTPNGGSFAPMQVLSGDDSFGNMLSIAGSPFRAHAARTVMAAFPGFLQLQAGLLDPVRQLGRADTWADLAREDLARAEASNWWHVLPIQRDALRWGVPTQAVLDQAVDLRKRLDAQLAKDLPRHAPRLLLVVGGAPFTPDGYELVPGGLVYLDAEAAGDGRVTLASAMLPGVRTWRVACDHGTLPRHREAFDAYVELLGTGRTTRLSQVSSAARRGAAVVHVRSRPSRARLSSRPPTSEVELLHRVARHRIEAAAPRGSALRISVINGDLTFVRQPLVLGHYRSLRLSGTEWVMDRLLQGDLDRALRIGVYPSEPGSSKAFVNRHRDPDNPWRLPRPEAVLIVGLGAEGELGASELVATIRQGVISWAERSFQLEAPTDGARRGGRPRAGAGGFEIAATLIGSGGAGVSAGESAQLVAQGVREANERLAGVDWPQVERLHLIELYLDRATEAWRALRVQQESAPAHYVVDDEVKTSVGALKRPLTADYRGAQYDFMSVQSRDEGNGKQISFRLATTRARTEVSGQGVQGALVRELVARASNDRNTDTQIGRTLFQLLVPLTIEPFLGDSTDMVIEVDDATAGIPWELLDTTAGGNGDARPWAIRSRLLRKLRTERFRPGPVDADADASVLVIGEPACDTSRYARLPGARAEANAVHACLSAALSSASRVTPLISPDDGTGADARTVINAILERPWRIIHVSGHGEPPDKEKGPRGVVLSNETFLGPNEIRSMRTVPELVFVNCCHLAARDAGGVLATEPPDRARFAADVAASLIDVGVRCVIAAGWAVDDEAASVFATTFYGALTRGFRFIDAVHEARSAAFARGGNTWAAYQCYGDPDWRLRTGVSDAQRPTEPIRDEFATLASPFALAHALEQIAIRSAFMTGDEKQKNVLPRIAHLETRFGDRWGGAGDVAEQFGAAWQGVGERSRAMRWYLRALAANDGSASMRAAEQLANLRARAAWEAAERAAHAPAAARREAFREARAGIGAAIALLARLVVPASTMERESLLGSAYKRLAMVEALAKDAAAEQRALQGMQRHYGRAERLGRRQRLRDVYYPAMNSMAAELVLDGARKDWPGFDARRLRAVRRSLAEKLRDEPDFWSVVGQGELRMLLAIASGTLADAVGAIVRHFGDVAERMPAPGNWGSVHDQAALVLRGYMGRSTPAEAAAAQRLLGRLRALRTGTTRAAREAAAAS